MQSPTHLIDAPVATLIRQLAIPASIGFFFNTMYNVVDTYYAGLVSTTALAAFSISFPVFFVIIALGTGISTGASALIANALGAGKRGEAIRLAAQSIVFAALVGGGLTIAGIAAAPALFRVLGASGDYLAIAVDYARVIFFASPLFALTFTMNSILSAQGDTKTFRNYLVAGFFLNFLLDPALLWGWGPFPTLGLPGIAWATFIVQVVGAAYMSWRAYRSGLLCRDCVRELRPQWSAFREIAGQGFPASLSMMTVALGSFIITWFVADYGQVAVAAYGIGTRVDQIALLPTIGLNIAVLTIVGQNNGARRFDRVREAHRVSLGYGAAVVAAGMAAVLLVPGLIMRVFTADPAVIAAGAAYLRVSALVYPSYLILYLVVATLQGLKQPLIAIWVGVYRQIVAPLPLFWLFASGIGLGLSGVWWGIVAVNTSAAVFTLWYATRRIARLGKAEG